MPPASPPTSFGLLLRLSMMGTDDAANFFGVRPDTINKWASGRREPPQSVIAGLANYIDETDEAVDLSLDNFRKITENHDPADHPGEIELAYATDDAEAQTLGAISAAQHLAIITKTAASALLFFPKAKIKIVPRGTTISTAAAADLHDKLLKKR